MDEKTRSDQQRISDRLSEIIYIIPDLESAFKEWLLALLESFPDGNHATQQELDNLGVEIKTNSCFWNSQKVNISEPEYLYYEGFAMNDDITSSMHHAFNVKNNEVKDFSALKYFPEKLYRYHGINIPNDFILKLYEVDNISGAIAENPNYIPFFPVLHKLFYYEQGKTIEECNKYGIDDKTIFF